VFSSCNDPSSSVSSSPKPPRHIITRTESQLPCIGHEESLTDFEAAIFRDKGSHLVSSSPPHDEVTPSIIIEERADLSAQSKTPSPASNSRRLSTPPSPPPNAFARLGNSILIPGLKRKAKKSDKGLDKPTTVVKVVKQKRSKDKKDDNKPTSEEESAAALTAMHDLVTAKDKVVQAIVKNVEENTTSYNPLSNPPIPPKDIANNKAKGARLNGENRS
jgi:hypothetical protein